MEFIKTSNGRPVVNQLVKLLREKLKSRRKVLWFVTGGSNIAVAVAVSRLLIKENPWNLTVCLSDERFGEVGHQDSNWRQLREAGFALPSAALIPILRGKPPKETAIDFAYHLKQAFAESEYRIGLLGIGADSHIAGIKPGSPAIISQRLADYYKWDDYERITMTFPAIQQLDTIITYLKGPDKKAAILNLQRDLPLEQYPAQIIKKVKKAIIFNDLVGEEAG